MGGGSVASCVSARDAGHARRAVVATVPSSLATDEFARLFLDWCASNDITGSIDWPHLYLNSRQFAEHENWEPISKMALAKALARLRIEKATRDIAEHETGLVGFNSSDAKRPRVTVYILPDRRNDTDGHEQQ